MKTCYVIFRGIGVFDFFALIIPSVFYLMFETCEFPTVNIPVLTEFKNVSDKAVSDLTDNEKGVLVSQAVINQLQRELDSPMGWTVNDIFISPLAYFDNRANRQRGVIFATRMLSPMFSNSMAKFGKNDNENENLKEARTTYLALKEDSWGFLFIFAERYYNNVINNYYKYQRDLVTKNPKNKTGELYLATCNIKTDDIYRSLMYITGVDFMDNVIGRLSIPTEQIGFINADDDIYYAQGVMLVIRDFVTTLYETYPEAFKKGSEKNYEEALFYMNKIATFNPHIVFTGADESIFADHRAKMYKYYMLVDARLNDVAESILK